MKNVIKFYEFSENFKSSKIYDNFAAFTFLPFIPLGLYYITFIYLEKILGKNFMPSIINKIIVFITLILGVIWLIRFKTSLKGVFIYYDYLQIERHSISNLYYMFRINPKIRYSEIKSCEINQKKSENYEQWNDKQLHFIGGSGDSYIRLETLYDKVYCFCIENQEDFVEEINKRIGKTNGTDGNATS